MDNGIVVRGLLFTEPLIVKTLPEREKVIVSTVTGLKLESGQVCRKAEDVAVTFVPLAKLSFRITSPNERLKTVLVKSLAERLPKPGTFKTAVNAPTS